METKIIHKVIGRCDAYAQCGITARNDNKSHNWKDVNCKQCLKFRRVLKEKKPAKEKIC